MKRTHLIAVLVGLVAVCIFAADASAYYNPSLGRFMSRDPGAGSAMRSGDGGPAIGGGFIPRDPTSGNQYADGMNLYQYCRSNPQMLVDPYGLKDYKIGKGPKPTIKWDNGYAYNPDAKPTWSDTWNWYKYGSLLVGAETVGDLLDGTRAYRHYREATGTDLQVNYDGAIRHDEGINDGFKAELAGAQADIEREHDGKTEKFSVHSISARLVNSTTENWQKALGGHRIWGTGEVTYDLVTCEYVLKITVEAEDFYNFNKGEVDIATGLPDNQNGRFEVFGWAKSFYSRGKVTRTVTWKRGEADKTKPEGQNWLNKTWLGLPRQVR